MRMTYRCHVKCDKNYTEFLERQVELDPIKDGTNDVLPK